MKEHIPISRAGRRIVFVEVGSLVPTHHRRILKAQLDGRCF